MRKAITAIVLASIFALSALAQSNNAGQQNDAEHHSKFSKLAVWRHHKDNNKAKSNHGTKASQPAAQPQVTATAMKPRPVKHISDMDDDAPAKPVAKSAKAPAHAANAKPAHVQLASSKAPAGKDAEKPAMHHAAKKSSAAKAKAAPKKSGKHAEKAEKKPA